MEDIINWCNFNSGFAQIILSFLTLLVSVIAIVVSIKNSKFPYKKKVILSSGSYIGVGFDDDGLHVTITNASFRPLQVKKLGLYLSKCKKILINMNTIGESQIKLESGQDTVQYFSSKYLDKVLDGFNKNKKIYAFFEDSEGFTKKKYICKIKQIKRNG